MGRAILTSDTDPIEVWLVSTSHQSTATSSGSGQPEQASEPQQDTATAVQPQQQPAAEQPQQHQEAQPQQLQPPPPRLQHAASGSEGLPAELATPPPRQLMSPLFKTEDRPSLPPGDATGCLWAIVIVHSENTRFGRLAEF